MHRSESADAYEGDIFDDEDDWLTTPISQLMPRKPVLIDICDTVEDAVHAMNVGHTGCVLVQEDGRLVGIFTERDVITKVFGRDDCHTVGIAEVMTKDPESLEQKDEMAFALNRMSVGGFRHIPIVDHGKPVGVLSVRDIVNYLADQNAAGVVNLPPTSDSVIVKRVEGA